MAKTKEIASRTVSKSVAKRLTPIWKIGILFPDGKKIIKPKCTLDEIFETYFINLDKYINPSVDAEFLLNQYKNTFNIKNIKVQINYVDSWGHTWRGKEAWPKDNKFLEYLNRRIDAFQRA